MMAYVGCRTTRERNANGHGLSVCTLDEQTGALRQVQLIRGLVNPSYLAFDQTRTILFVVHGDRSEVSAFRIRNDGLLDYINRQDTAGRNPVHLAVDATNQFLLVANYATGSVACFPFAADGTIGALCDLMDLPGAPGPHKTEQPCSHPHQILPDPQQRFFIVPDKGLDRTFVLALDAAAGKLHLHSSEGARPGAGPRHAVFHPSGSMLFLLNELDSTVARLAFDPSAGRLTSLEVAFTLPGNFFGANTGAGIVLTPCGGFVYASNRGHDSIACLHTGLAARRFEAISWTPVGGKTPRFVTLAPNGEILYVANERSDSITAFRIDQEDGSLTSLGQVMETGSPVCILFHNP
jgi:6-phosphogluconolactonase